MTETIPHPMPELARAIEQAIAQPQLLAEVDRLYEQIRVETAARKPLCVMSGRCCHFESYGHRMYVSTVELAAFVAGVRGLAGSQNLAAWDGTGCPFQVGKTCGVHSIRPMGCRVFFCDPTSTDWQTDLYEKIHNQLRKLHESWEIPYFYVEWRQALAAVGLARQQVDVGE